VTQRIHKAIAASGLASLRNAERMIREGRVAVNGEDAVIGQRIDPVQDRVEVDGVVLPVAPGLSYYLLNKPRDVVSTAADTHGRKTVVDLVAAPSRVWPVGRLDADSEGLIILTNDGTLTHRLTHPRFDVEKTYTVLVLADVAPEDVARLTAGVELDDGLAVARSARLVDQRPGKTLVEVVMMEGRNREVRRMFATLGYDVERLVRTAIGGLRDQQLRPGTARLLTIEEVRGLYEVAGAAWQDDDPTPTNGQT